MLDAAFKALAQMFTRPFRAVLWKSIGLAAVLIIIVGIGLNRVLVWLAGVAQGWAEQTLGVTTNMPVSVLAWLLSFAATVGIIAGSVLLMPAVTALVASLFVDEIGAEVERSHYPDEPAGQGAADLARLVRGLEDRAARGHDLSRRAALLAACGLRRGDLLSLHRVPARTRIFHPGRDAVSATCRGQAIAPHAPGHDIHRRAVHRGLCVDPDFLNLATPLFGMAFMVHMHKRLVGTRPDITERDSFPGLRA